VGEGKEGVGEGKEGVEAGELRGNLKKFQIPNHKFQINLNFQYSNTFFESRLNICDLELIWNL
jgi:hypothetical protein